MERKIKWVRILSIFIITMLLLFNSGYVSADTSVLESSVNGSLGGDSFTFVQLTDLHIGEGVNDYGTTGYDDSASSGNEGAPAQRLREAVSWINTNKETRNIAFVIVTGDMTDSGEKSEFLKAKEILDTLTIPYIPMLGNHDVWPYTSSQEASSPIGDEYFKDIFAPVFTSLGSSFSGWSDGTRLTRVWNSENDCYCYFQNFSFNYRGYHFMFADFNARQHAPFGYKGVGPEANLYDFTGGTWQWFTADYNNFSPKGNDNILIFAHHPLTKDIYGGIVSFSVGEYNKIANFLNDNNKKNYTGLWNAGHLHRSKEYSIKTWLFSTICPGIETGPAKDGYLRLITVWGAAQ